MNLKTLVSAMLVVVATPCVYAASATNPSPANFATADTHTTTMKDFLARKSQATTTYASGGMFFAYASTGTSSKPPADYRAAFGEDYKVNGIVKLSWKGTSGTSTVKITRLSDGNVRTLTTSGTSVDFLAPEIGRNYKWTVTNGGTESGPWYFFTDGEAPRIIPQELAKVGNCRDMGGWVTEDGNYRVRQGLGYRNDHNADFYQYADLKPFWTDIAKIRTDMDLRDKATASQWYCNWELDDNSGSPGRSPYGEHWWDVLYWNVLREGDYGAKMNDYASLVNNIGASPASTDSKKASVNTWKLFADAENLPIVVHCSQGRDRTGTVAFVLLGALGVGLNDLYADWALTDYSAPSDFPKATANEGGSTIVALYNALVKKYPNATYPTLQSKCEKLLTDLGVSAGELQNLKSYFLEPVEQKLTAAPGGSSVAVPTLSKSRVSKTGSAQKPTVATSSYYTVDYGGGDYTNYGKYLVTVTLKDPTTTHWSDGTIGPKVLPFIIEHVTNVMIGDAVLSFIKGDTSPHIRIGRPRYLGEVSCSYTEEQLNNLPPGDYEATFTAKTCEMASKANTATCKFKVYPATEKATYTYEYADLKSAFFKTDYAPAIQTDKVEVRMMDQTAGEGYAPFACGPYPASMTIMKMSGGFLRYHHGAQRVDNDPGTWTVNKIYKLTASGKSITHYDEATAMSVTKSFSAFDSVNPTPGTAYIGCAVDKTANMGAEGTPGYCQPHRIYHVKAWANGSSLIHEFVPCKTTSGYAMLYDKVTKKIYPFSHTLNNTGSVTLGGAATKLDGGDDPDPGPTPDTKAVTYTWKGGTAQWAASASWTPGTGATYGYPDSATYATADFPAGVTAATTCTLASDVSVLKALFDSPNLTLVLDNAALTVASTALDTTTWGAYNFGNTKTGNPTIEFKGAKAALVTTHAAVRANFGYQGGDTASGTCTLRFTVPATGWETTAPIRTASDSKVIIEANVKLAVNATALGVPAAGVTKKVLLASSTDGMFYSGTATVTCASGASGEVVVEGNDLVLKVTGGATPQPEPEPTPMTKFDAAHTIICYGDSLTWGTAAAVTTMDSRANFFEGRLAGFAEMPQGYPWWLSGMIPSNYNVIHQARPGAQTCNITSWSGEQTVKVKTAFTLPAIGSVSLDKNLVFGSDCSYGEQGGWAKGEPDDQDVQNRWYGFVTPNFPLMEGFDETKTHYSITGTLGGRHVRLQGLHPTNVTVTVFGEGTAKTVTAGSEFVPDNELVSPYKEAIRVICTGANDGDKNYAAEIKPHLVAFAAKGGKYLIVSPSVNTGTASGTNATATEQDMASTFGEHYLNLRLKMETEGKATADALGVSFTGKWTNTDGTGLKAVGDSTHFNEKGYKVMAEFIRQKLVALGYITGDEPQPDPEPTYHEWIQTDNQGFFKTTFVPNLKTTKLEVKVMATDAVWTTVLAANGRTATGSMETPYGNLIFLGFNANGTVDWNNTYNGVNCGKTVAGGAFNAVHTLTACGNSITVDGVTSTGSSAAQNQSPDGPLFIGAPYDTTSESIHPLKIYYVKVWNGDALIHNYVPGVTAAGAAILYDTVEKKELTPTKGGAFYCGDDQPGPSPEPEPEPTSTSAFDAAHTIVCYGDSLTWGTAAAEITMDGRANYHDGRLAGVSGVPESYTYWLSGMISDYNVINQSRAGSPASHMTAWTGDSEVVVDQSFTLPATGSVSIPTNLVFASDCPWGKWGRWASHPSKWDDPVETFEHWAGFVTPIFPLYEKYDGEKTRFSITGTLCGRHVRVQGIYPNVTTVTVFGTGTAQTVPVGAKFVPDNATLPLYTQGIRILCGSGNDGYYGYHGGSFDDGFAKYAKPYFDAFAAKGGKYLIVSQCCQTEDPDLGETQYQSTPTDMETKMAAAYGAHYLNLRMAFMTNGVATAKALGVWPEGSTKPWYDPSTLFHDGTHFTSAGYKVMAEFIRRKLVEIGYVGGEQPAPVDPTAYGTKDTKASEYTWKGFSGPWAYTTNWTPSASATYGIPNHTTYATATFPDSLANAFVCTVSAKTDVNKFSFKSPNGTLKIANAALTASAAVGGGSVASLEFGDSLTGDSVLEFSGANAMLKATINGYRLNVGYTGGGTPSGSCTLRYVVPAANWSAAPLQGVGGSAQDGSKVCFWKKARVAVDATALGVPAEGQTIVVPLAFGTEAISFYGGTSFEQFAAASEVVCAKGATGTLVLNGSQLEAQIVRDETPGEPEPEPTPDAFDIDHTIVCYGDSITAGWGSEVRAADDRVNYFGGRLAGQTKGSGSGMGYPYMLAGLITNSYNVIEQAKGSMWSDTITAWMGGIDIEVRCDVTLPANGAKTWCPSNLVFGAENPYGREGGLHNGNLIYYDYYDFWAGVQTTDLPVIGGYPEPAGRWSSFSGWIGDVHVRVTGVETGTVPERTAGYYATDHHWSRIGSAEAVTIPAGAKFVPDAVNVYQDAIAVVFAGTNDQNGNPNKATNVIANVAHAVAKIPRGRYVVVSPFAPKVRTDAVDQLYKNEFGEHLVPLYDLMESQGLARAVKLGVMTQAEADKAGHWNTVAGLMDDPDTQDLHPNARGAMVIASFIKDRLIALGYIPNDEPQIDPTEYGPADKTAATYTWKGNSGPWAYTTNWTPSTSATYGIPNNKTYATALFPADVTAPFDCTVDSSTAVKALTFQSPNGTLKIANAALTVSGTSSVGAWSSVSFGDSPAGDSVLEFSGANAMLKATAVCYRLNIGSTVKAAASGTCTVRYVVPASNWAAAPLQAIGGYTTDGSKVCFGTNVRVEVDATALGVPAEGQTVVVPLAFGTEGIGFYDGITFDEFAAASKIVCAKGAKGTLVLNGTQLELQIVALASDYPSWIDDMDKTTQGKYDAWKQAHVVNDPEAEQGKEAFLLNCDDTPEAVAEAKKEFVIESITFNADGTVTVTVSSETQKGYNGRVVIRGAAEVDGDYDLPQGSDDARFFKAFLEYVPANAD